MTLGIILSKRNLYFNGVTWLPRIKTLLPQLCFQQEWPNDKILVNEIKAEVSYGTSRDLVNSLCLLPSFLLSQAGKPNWWKKSTWSSRTTKLFREQGKRSLSSWWWWYSWALLRKSLASPGLTLAILPSHDRQVNFILSQCCFNLQNRVIIKLILIPTKYSVFQQTHYWVL